MTTPQNPVRASPRIVLVYDDECPMCDAWCRMVRIRESVGTLQLVNARVPGPEVDEITRRGLDIDEGMVLIVDDALFYGADAIHAICLMSTAAGVFNRFNHWVFRSPGRARWLYPVLREMRGVALRLLRKTRINNLGVAGRERF
jgi:predicted DCC family thiol-disulfide oxidoreductase YuxK